MYKKRVLATVITVFITGIVFGITIVEKCDIRSLRAALIVLCVAAAVCCAVFSRAGDDRRYKRATAVAVAVAAFSCGGLRVALQADIGSAGAGFIGAEDNAVMSIVSAESDHYDCELVKSDIGVPSGKYIRYYLRTGEENGIAGDIITAKVVYASAASRSCRAADIFLSASGSVSAREQGSGLLYGIRGHIRIGNETLYAGNDTVRAIANAVTVGDRSGMDARIYMLFRSAGISHILAISGLHISITAMSVYYLLLVLGLNRRLCGIVGAAVAVLYTAVVGFTPGAVRAAVMLACGMLFKTVLIRFDSITAMFMALFVLVLINPYSLCSAGLMLSFLCCLGIILASPLFQSIGFAFRGGTLSARLLRRAVSLVAVPAAVSAASGAFSFPVLFSCFDTASTLSPLINIIVVPLFSLATRLSFAASIIVGVLPRAASAIAAVSSFIIGLVVRGCELVDSLGIAVISLRTGFAVLPLLLSLAAIAALVLGGRRRRIFSGIAVAAFAVSVFGCGIAESFYIKNERFIEYSDAKTGYIITCREGELDYIDISGVRADTDPVYESGFTRVDKYIVTCFDENAAERFYRFSGSISVREVVLPAAKDAAEKSVSGNIAATARLRGCTVSFYSDDDMHYDPGAGYLISGNYLGSGGLYFTSRLGEKKICIFTADYTGSIKCDIAVAAECSAKLESPVLYCRGDNAPVGTKRLEFGGRIRFDVKKGGKIIVDNP